WNCLKSRWPSWPPSHTSRFSSACGPCGSNRARITSKLAVTRRLEPYWYALILIAAAAAILYGYHLATGFTPPRAAFALLGLPVYWYGIWIITGVAMGAWVVSRLAAERARRVFAATVPAETRSLLLGEAGLPEATTTALTARKMTTLGDALYEAGLDPRRLGLKKPQTD